MPWCDIIPWTPFEHNRLTRIPPMTWLWVKSLYSDVNLRLFFFCFAFYGPFKNISLMLSPLLSRGRRITTWPSINRNGLSKMCSAKAWSCIYLCLSSQSMSWFYILWHILYIQGQIHFCWYLYIHTYLFQSYLWNYVPVNIAQNYPKIVCGYKPYVKISLIFKISKFLLITISQK